MAIGDYLSGAYVRPTVIIISGTFNLLAGAYLFFNSPLPKAVADSIKTSPKSEDKADAEAAKLQGTTKKEIIESESELPEVARLVQLSERSRGWLLASLASLEIVAGVSALKLLQSPSGATTLVPQQLREYAVDQLSSYIAKVIMAGDAYVLGCTLVSQYKTGKGYMGEPAGGSLGVAAWCLLESSALLLTLPLSK
ncbi:hypothetical protein AKO1_011384 [Acrasis kona]|uniref:Uncharacterized protein n=1 Tax=Acrasis kona TaxID=1008807 RepID=A0AAW2YXW4_9EUKA